MLLLSNELSSSWTTIDNVQSIECIILLFTFVILFIFCVLKTVWVNEVVRDKLLMADLSKLGGFLPG